MEIRELPGTRIKRVLHKFNIRPSQKCGCYKLAQEMDQVGSKVVLERIDSYTEKMYESIKEWRRAQKGFTILIKQPPKVVVKKFIQWACSSLP